MDVLDLAQQFGSMRVKMSSEEWQQDLVWLTGGITIVMVAAALLLRTPKGRKLLSYCHLPHWAKDNHYIQHGYREIRPQLDECFLSLTYLHNETGNIFSHLSGFSFLVLLAAIHVPEILDIHEHRTLQLPVLAAFLPPSLLASPNLDLYVWLPFLVGNMLCLGFSALFHLFLCHSERYFKVFSKLDYLGIVLAVLGALTTWCFFTYGHCQEPPAILLALLASYITAPIAMVYLLQDKYATPEYRSLRTIIFASFMAASSLPYLYILICPLSHPSASRLHNDENFLILFLAHMFIMSGAVLFALRLPERLKPGRFDFWGHSHQIFHCMVFIGIYTMFLAIKHSYEHAGEFMTC